MSMDLYQFMVEPVSTWTTSQMLMFPALFVLPAEMLAKLIDLGIWYMSSRKGLPGWDDARAPLGSRDHAYIWFNRMIMLPFVSFLNIRVIWASSAVVWPGADSVFEAITVWNSLFAFICVFALSDLVYYIGHRIVHANPALYSFVHKHHHGEAYPQRGWADTCNAHPTDFFYTGFSTSPMSVLWLMPAGSVHIATIACLLYVNMFVGALGHSRLDIDIWFFRTRFHAGHHAMFKYNYAQNIELWDRLFGTYKELPDKDRKPISKSLKAE